MTQGFEFQSIKVVRVHITSSVKWKSIYDFLLTSTGSQNRHFMTKNETGRPVFRTVKKFLQKDR